MTDATQLQIDVDESPEESAIGGDAPDFGNDIPSVQEARQIPGLPDMRVGGDPGSTVLEVTPDLARKWLARNHPPSKTDNPSNRPIRRHRIERYAKMMERSEKWTVTPDAIGFDVDGKLTNGQHRLMAIVESGEPQRMIVGWNLPEDSIRHTDVGAKRTPGDALAVEGFDDPIHLASAARLVVLHRRGDLQHCYKYNIVENFEIIRVAEICDQGEHNRLQESVRYVGNLRSGKGGFEGKARRSLLTFVHFAYWTTYTKPKINEYIEKVAKGEETSSWEGGGNPATLMRNEYFSEGDLDKETELAYLIKTANAFLNGREMKRLRYRDSDSFPEPEIDTIEEFKPGSV
jgi:hypothetical protein